MADKKEKQKITTARETGYSLYEDGRHTYLIRVEDCAQQRHLSSGKDLVVSLNKGYSTSIGPLNLADLKALRKLILEAIRHYEDNESFQI